VRDFRIRRRHRQGLLFQGRTNEGKHERERKPEGKFDFQFGSVRKVLRAKKKWSGQYTTGCQ